MNWDDFRAARVPIGYANMSRMNRVRAWARRNNARVECHRYARDSYEGVVVVPMPAGREAQAAKVAELKAVLNG